MKCDALWLDEAVNIGTELSNAYQSRLTAEDLMGLAAEAQNAKGEPGGATDEESDKHFAWRFSNSAGRSVYVCTDPLETLGSVSQVVSESLLGGDVLIVDVPCGSGAGALGLLSALYEQRKSRQLPTLPLNVTLIAGDYSGRSRAHMGALVSSLSQRLATQQINLLLVAHHWDASDIRSSASLIDLVVQHAGNAQRVFLLVSNFSAALADAGLKVSFEHFLSQYSSRVRAFPSVICWLEPNTKGALKLLPGFDSWIDRVLGWIKKSAVGRVASTTYKMRDPLTGKIYPTGVAVLKCTTEGLPW